jgi:hypothetical protein
VVIRRTGEKKGEEVETKDTGPDQDSLEMKEMAAPQGRCPSICLTGHPFIMGKG